MDMLEESGLATMVGKVNMDRNGAPELQEKKRTGFCTGYTPVAGRDQGTLRPHLPNPNPTFYPILYG